MMWGRQAKGWVLGLGLLSALSFGPGLFDMARLWWVERRLDRRLAELARQQERLAREQKRLETDPVYVEGLIRSTFKVSEPNELVVPLPSTDASSSR